MEFKKEEIEQSIPDRFEQMARLYPDRLAVTTKARSRGLTYEEVNKAANRIARALLDTCGERNEPVPILVEEDEGAIAAILGVLKAGKIYVPLDPSLSEQRIISILDDCQASCIITDSAQQPVARSLWGQHSKLISVDELDRRISGTDPGLAISPDKLAFILYTSGTTSVPKGVVQNHRNILHSIRAYTNDIHICPDDRLSLLFSLIFHGSVRGLFGALLNGASVHRFDPKRENLQELIAWLMAQEITIYHSTATLFRNFAPMLSGNEQFTKLRIVQLAAESVIPRDVELFKRFFPSSCIFTNRLGTTETGTYLRFQVDTNANLVGQSVPVGYPVDGMHVFLLNDAGKEVGCNEAGEIAVKSRYLSPGYWRKPNLTKANFVPDPNGGDERMYLTGDMGRMDTDGCFSHLGRKDFQVKIRGFQIDIGEVETILLNHPGIKEVAVMSLETQSGDTRLMAYCVSATKPGPNVSELRRFLQEKLPDYMIPSAFMLLDRMPLTPNGKIDRQALPAPNNVRPELDAPYFAPRTPLEEHLTEIWAEVLGLDRVGIHDNFFHLGGHSLAATRIVSQVIRNLQLELPLQSLFQLPTVAEMAAVIAEHQGKNLGREELERILTEIESISDEEAQRLLPGQGRREDAKE